MIEEKLAIFENECIFQILEVSSSCEEEVKWFVVKVCYELSWVYFCLMARTISIKWWLYLVLPDGSNFLHIIPRIFVLCVISSDYKVRSC